MSMLHLTYQVPGDDFTRAGEASGDVKHKLKKLGYEPDAVRPASPTWTRPCRPGGPPPRTTSAPWALGRAWACPT